MLNYALCRLNGFSSKKRLSLFLKVDAYKFRNVDGFFVSPSFTQRDSKGKDRVLYNPNKEYKLVLNRICRDLQRIEFPNYVFGGLKGKSYVQNAEFHINGLFYLTLDLKNFFPSTNDYYVFNFFRNKMGMSVDISKIMTLLVTEPNKENSEIRSLPQGFPTSPVLSYLCYVDMFQEINKYAEDNGIKFSCYYDDLTFSSDTKINKSFRREVEKIVEQYRLKVNKKKTRLKRNVNGVKITGVILKENRLLAPNKLHKKMMDRFNQLTSLDLEKARYKKIDKLCNSVRGCCSAITSVDRSMQFPYILSEVRKYDKIKSEY